MTEQHMTDGFDTRPADQWFWARCVCGWKQGPLPDAETAVDALMEHAYNAALAARLKAPGPEPVR